MSDTKPAAPIPKSPSERYSWVSSGSQCTKQIIDRTSSPASPSFARTQTASKNYFDHPTASNNPSSSSPSATATTTAADHHTPVPPLPRRSSYNYAHDAEEFKRLHSSSTKEASAAVAVDDKHHNEAIFTSPITEGSFKPKMHGRTKSWDYQDVKRLQHRGLMMTNAEEAKGIGKEGEGGAYGFTEKK